MHTLLYLFEGFSNIIHLGLSEVFSYIIHILLIRLNDFPMHTLLYFDIITTHKLKKIDLSGLW